ncbi:MAG: RIP metalloprotease RseP [Bdellovibrionota bacterium]
MTYLFGFVVLLGVLIFIHELGHFLLAKACGVRVETFSIGMGHKILKFTRGETEYALSLIPLGGYVKLTGQDPREEVPKELENRSFRHKAIWQRTLVVLAGPIFNAALTMFIFFFLYLMGAPSAAPVVERVLSGSIAAQAGLQSGDWVHSITTPAGKVYSTRELSDLEDTLNEHVGEELTLAVQHDPAWASSSTNSEIKIVPAKGFTRDSTLGVLLERGLIPGTEKQSRAPLLHVRPGTWAATRQIPEAFWIESVEVQVGSFSESYPIRTYGEFERLWTRLGEKTATANEGQIIVRGQQMQLSQVENASEPAELPTTSYTLAWTRLQDRMPATPDAAGLSSSELVVLEVKEKTPAATLGLKQGDEILTLNGENVQSFLWFREHLQDLAHTNKEIQISWRRGSEILKASVIPEKVSTTDPVTEAKKEQFQIGAAFLALPGAPMTYTLKSSGFVDAIELGWKKSVNLSISMVASFYYLATGEISPKTLGGPLLIGKIAGESVKQGWEAFLKMMAFISLNLFILNLLPVPVLDGGHLVLFAIEAVRRKPVSLKIVEVWTTTGFFLLMGLVAVVFFNDLSRLGLFKIFGS